MKFVLRDFIGTIATKNLSHLHAIEEEQKKWKIISHLDATPHSTYSAILRQHPTQAHHIITARSNAREILHRSSYTKSHTGESIPLTSPIRYDLISRITESESEGNSLDGIATKNIYESTIRSKDIHGLTFIGFVTNTFSILPESKETLRAMKDSGTDFKIASREALATCKAIAKKAGMPCLDDTCITSIELQGIHDEELRKIIPHITIFAELEDIDISRLTRLSHEFA